MNLISYFDTIEDLFNHLKNKFGNLYQKKVYYDEISRAKYGR